MRIVIAGGGTGGHLFPGIALAEEFKSRNESNEIVFVGTKKGIEQRIIPPMGYELKMISGTGILGGSLFQKVMGIFRFLVGCFQALGLLRSLRPNLVLGTGGYASAPVMLAAYLSGLETAICEQNSIPGLTNRMLGKFVKKIFIAFEKSSVFFPCGKTFFTGNPVRKAFLYRSPYLKKEGDRFTLLILGGSQGARSVNRAMVACLDNMAPLWDKVEIIHQSGFQDFSWVKEAYEKKGLQADVRPFITDMVDVYERADLIVSRAGAISITEILICGKPSILVPYPYAAYNHQDMNARVVADNGAARIIADRDLTGGALAETILYLMNHPAELTAMREKTKVLARPEAARTIVDHYCVPGQITKEPAGVNDYKEGNNL